jgi:hypothetical protein
MSADANGMVLSVPPDHDQDRTEVPPHFWFPSTDFILQHIVEVFIPVDDAFLARTLYFEVLPSCIVGSPVQVF